MRQPTKTRFDPATLAQDQDKVIEVRTRSLVLRALVPHKDFSIYQDLTLKIYDEDQSRTRIEVLRLVLEQHPEWTYPHTGENLAVKSESTK